MARMLVTSWIVVLISGPVAQAQGRTAGNRRAVVLWTVSGAGAGFGVGAWAGLTAFDDAVNSDRKVWTSAIVGTGVGALAGYLIGRSLGARDRAPSTTPTSPTQQFRLFAVPPARPGSIVEDDRLRKIVWPGRFQRR